jgi:malonyl-CoA/methylmalonyl-CoA synthetase
MGDRTNFSPKHVGPNILPSFPLFTQLLTTAHRKPTSIAIRDVNLNTQSTYVQLLTDVLSLRRSIENVLDPATLRQIQNGEEVFIVVVAPGGYEFTVAILAVLALGAAGVPISTFPGPWMYAY